ncbi:MAG: hypothetical protein ACOC2C_01145, partial [Cyclonatronaceae bacterium]
QAGDFSGDGQTELLSGGNLMGAKPQTGSFAASRPTIMFYDETTESLKSAPSPTLPDIDGEVRRIIPLTSGPESTENLLIIRYDDTPEVLQTVPEIP